MNWSEIEVQWQQMQALLVSHWHKLSKVAERLGHALALGGLGCLNNTDP